MNIGTVYETIRKLAELKQPVTLSSIASTAGLPRKYVLDVLHRNRVLLTWQRKASTRLATYATRSCSAAVKAAKAEGRGYTHGEGGYKKILVVENCQAAEPLRAEVRVGPLADFAGRFILDTPENVAALDALGLVDLDSDARWSLPGVVEWEEGAP